MALTLKAAITATQTTVDIAGSDALSEGDVRSIDSEYVEIRSAAQATLQYGQTAYYRATIKRGVQGSAKATHAAAATLTAVLPGEGGGSGIPQGGPLTEPLDVSDQALTSAASGSNAGASVTVATATVDGGGTVEAQAGEHPDGGSGAYMGLFGGEDGAGGTGQFQGGNAIAGAAGGSVTFQAGSGDDGSDAGAKVVVQGGDGEGAAGVVRVTANAIEFDITGPLVHQGGPLTADLDADGSKIVNLGATEDPNDAATKAYVDNRTVRFAEGVPSGEPTGTELPIAFDSTAVTGGVYYWTGLAWVKGGTI